MRVEVLGPVRLRASDGRAVEIPERKVRALLAVLTAADGEVVPADALVDRVWGEAQPANPARVLQAKLSQLRKLLAASDSAGPNGSGDAAHGALSLVRENGGYRLDLPDGGSDVAVLRDAVRRAQDTEDPAERVEILSGASDLWRGRPFGEFTDELWAAADSAALAELRLQAAELEAGGMLETSSPEAALEIAEPLLSAHPTRERLVAVVLRAFYLTGRQPEAMTTYERLRVHLSEQFGTDPNAELQELYVKILRQDPELDPPEPPARARGGWLPAYSSPFFDRTREVAALGELLGEHRLVTLLGIGGIGKTRLAVRVAERASQDDGVDAWFVDLNELRAESDEADTDASERVAGAVAATLGLPTSRTDSSDLTGRIAASLSERDVVVVLDNCEHVITGVARFTAELLRAAPPVRVLATSREPLALPEEQRFVVPDLLEGSAATEFFLSRARAVNPDVDPEDPETVAAAEQLSTHLDGLPLALELAAARTAVLTVPELLDRIADRLDLFARPGRAAPRRQQTLRGMLDWSWSLLDEPERVLLRRLAVHPVTWRLETMEDVVAGDSLRRGEILPALSRLVDSSLVEAVPTGRGLRYRLVETVCFYASEKLDEAGDRADVAAKHLAYFRELSECADTFLFGPTARSWIEWLDAERVSLSYALEEAVARDDVDNATALAMSTFWYRWMTSRIDSLPCELSAVAECPVPDDDPALRNRRTQIAVLARTIEQCAPSARPELVLEALEQFPDDAQGREARLEIQWFAATALLPEREYREVAESLVAETIDHLIDRGTLAWAAFVTTQRDWFRVDAWGEPPLGLPRGLDAEAILREAVDRYGLGQALGVRYLEAQNAGETARARKILDEVSDIAVDLGLEGELAYWELERSLNALRDGHFETAERHLEQSRELSTRTAFQYCLVLATAVEAELAERRGQRDEAEELRARLSPEERDVAASTIRRTLGAGVASA